MSVTNVVLVHGAWADGSCWSAIIERLQQASYSVTAVQLDLTSLSGDLARVRQVLSAQTSPTILVAHSYGGGGGRLSRIRGRLVYHRGQSAR